MKHILTFFSCLLVICTADGQDSDTSTFDKPPEIILMPPNATMRKISPKPVSQYQQSLISLYKTSVIKKPIMRKFIPVQRTTVPPIKVSRRPLMKQSQLIIGSRTVKPHIKEDIHVSNQRRMNFPKRARPQHISKSDDKVPETVNSQVTDSNVSQDNNDIISKAKENIEIQNKEKVNILNNNS